MYARSKTGGMYTIFNDMDVDNEGFVRINNFIRYHESKVKIPTNTVLANQKQWLSLVTHIKK